MRLKQILAAATAPGIDEPKAVPDLSWTKLPHFKHRLAGGSGKQS